ncbi:MAG: RimK family alpha-L-glutamate ligase [Desulfococcaceae bacterium]
MRERRVIALERRLRKCRNVHTIGIRTHFCDYSPEETKLIRKARKIYYPTTFYADLFDAMGKPTFPSFHSYCCAQDKIKQNTLFELLDIPRPRTRVFFGKRWRDKALSQFDFPFVAKVPRGSALGRGVFLVRSPADLDAYRDQVSTAAYLQEYLPADRDIRVVVIGGEPVLAYWRIAPPGDFRSNVGAGGRISTKPVPPEAVELAVHTARACRWDDVGVDVLLHAGRFYVLEGNMKYGRQGFAAAGMDYHKVMEALIADERI